VSVTSFAAAQLIRALPRVPLSRFVGRLCEQALPSTVSGLVQKVYCSAYDVNLAEAVDAGPYPSFDAFFTRPLRAGVRPIAADRVVSPADGRLSAAGPVDSGGRIVVKRQAYDVAELIGDAADAVRYRGGEFAVVYLAPSDYHRVHSPVDGTVGIVRGIPGDLYPVNSIGEAHIDGLFVRNNRVCVAIDTAELGRVSVILVGATIVGRISVSFVPEPAVPPGVTRLDPPERVARGDELGMFHLGSTAVVLFEPGVHVGRSPGVVRYGQPLTRDP
jgi:phosphatidylserine decarboxylase